MTAPQNFSGFTDLIVGIISLAIPVLVGGTILVFFWGLTKFIRNSGSEDSHENGRQLMIWGVIGLFVMVSVWAIVNFFTGSLGFPGYERFKFLPQEGATTQKTNAPILRGGGRDPIYIIP